jgi:GAF domain-containing protein
MIRFRGRDVVDDGGNPGDHGGMAIQVGTPQDRLAQARADLHWAIAERQRIEQQLSRLRAYQDQRAIDAEIAETRRILVHTLHRRGGTDAVAFLDPDFLALADRPAIITAILDAAVSAGAADSCDLQVYEPATARLRMEAQRGFGDDFLAFFDIVEHGQPTACAAALVTRRAVLVDDVTHSPLFAGQPTLAPLRAAGTRAVRSYPLLAPDGTVHAVLSLHYRRPAPRRGVPELVAAGATQALASMPHRHARAVSERSS